MLSNGWALRHHEIGIALAEFDCDSLLRFRWARCAQDRGANAAAAV